jgi:trehalose-phosphatase
VLALTIALLPSSKYCRVRIPTTVVPRKGHKGHIVKKILHDTRARNKNVDFVLCMGDDISDEKMFTVRHP